MNASRSSEGAFCPDCGATFPDNASRCWLCGAAVERVVAARVFESPFAGTVWNESYSERES